MIKLLENIVSAIRRLWPSLACVDSLCYFLSKKRDTFRRLAACHAHSTRFKLIDLEQRQASEHVASRRGKETKRRGLIKGLRYGLVNFSGDLHEENVFPALTVSTH